VNKPSGSRIGSPRRRRFSPSQIQRFVADFERSGLSASAFARQRGLCYSAFCRWRKRPRPPRFQPLALGTLFAPTWMAEIALPNGVSLRVNAQASPVWANEMLRMLSVLC
jgi:transposase-like protein